MQKHFTNSVFFKQAFKPSIKSLFKQMCLLAFIVALSLISVEGRSKDNHYAKTSTTLRWTLRWEELEEAIQIAEEMKAQVGFRFSGQFENESLERQVQNLGWRRGKPLRPYLRMWTMEQMSQEDLRRSIKQRLTYLLETLEKSVDRQAESAPQQRNRDSYQSHVYFNGASATRTTFRPVTRPVARPVPRPVLDERTDRDRVERGSEDRLVSSVRSTRNWEVEDGNVSSSRNVARAKEAVVRNMIQSANRYEGEHEKSVRGRYDNFGFQNPEFERKMRAFGGFYARARWCAIFAKMVAIEAARLSGQTLLEEKWRQLISPSVQDSWRALDRSTDFLTEDRFGRTLEPQAGDIAFWRTGRSTGHIGIVVAVNGSQIVTIEGNTSGNGSGSDIVVAQKTHNKYESNLLGYARPKDQLFI